MYLFQLQSQHFLFTCFPITANTVSSSRPPSLPPPGLLLFQEWWCSNCEIISSYYSLLAQKWLTWLQQEEILQSIKYLGDFLLGNDGIENLQARPEAAAESHEELLAGSEVYDDIMELKKRRRRR